MYLQPTPYLIETKVWLWTGKAAWYFVSIGVELSETINQEFSYLKGGWGSIPVELTVGKTTWKTSMFPNSKTKEYIIPIKSAIRKSEKISENDIISIQIQILV
jgi:hypothetical protein